MAWKHSPTYVTKRGGKVRVTCVCGAQSLGWLLTMGDAKAWYTHHTGLRERKRPGKDN